MDSEDVLTVLERARFDRPELRRIIDLQRELLAAEVVKPEVPEGFVAVAAARMADGKPAIDPRALALDWGAVARRLREVYEIVARADGGDGELAGSVDAAAAQELAVAFLTGEPFDAVTALVLIHSLRPFLRPLAQAALATPEAQAWIRGDCPACGGPPDFAVLEGEGGSRRLLCGRCDAQWAYKRVGCPFCDNEEPSTLAYFPAGEGRHRLYVCDRCRGYLKTLDLRETWGSSSLPAERILAVGLDLAAARAGYGRGAIARS